MCVVFRFYVILFLDTIQALFLSLQIHGVGGRRYNGLQCYKWGWRRTRVGREFEGEGVNYRVFTVKGTCALKSMAVWKQLPPHHTKLCQSVNFANFGHIV